MTLDLFAGIPVRDYQAALRWYEQLFGEKPSFIPNDVEAVWELAEHRYVYIVQEPERAGNALVVSFVEDLRERVAAITRRGIEPVKRETYENGVTKVIYEDPEGNEIAFGGMAEDQRPGNGEPT
ncbi:VOC family protein [Nonomuraea salmonea]|uniref:VOC family protein n=1 Tax=Nonomuraea salmonea TaxID=46181 RepID=A0ABV5NWT5_9ACTN